jgi:hypothetical protein
MTRRRYVQIKGELVEITDDELPSRHADSGALWGDRSYDGLRATDGTDISTRAKHREYMKLNNLATVDDFKETWSKAQEQRDRYRQSGGTFSRRDIERAISQLQRR